MFKVLDGASEGTAAPEIASLFTTPLTQVVVASSRIVESAPINPVNSSGPYEFKINGGKCYIDLSKSYLVSRFKLIKEDGTAFKATDKVGVLNFAGATLARQIQLSVGGEMIYDSGPNAHYISYLTNLLSYDSNYRSSVLAIGGWRNETDPSSDGDAAYKRSFSLVEGIMEFAAPLPIPLFMQQRALLSNCDLRVVIYPQSGDMMADARGSLPADAKVQLVMENLTLCTRHLTLFDSAALTLDTLVREKQQVTYPVRNLQLRTLFCSAGRQTIPEHTIFVNALPRRVIVGFVPTKAFLGDPNSNPFAFTHANVLTISLETSNGDVYPARPWSLDFDKRIYSRAYMALQSAFLHTGDTNSYTPEQFARAPLFHFDLSPSGDSTCELLRSGETKLHAIFDKAVPAGGLYAIILAEFDSTVHILASRSAKVDVVV